MSMKEIDDDNATRGYVYTITTIEIHTNKSIEHATNSNKCEGKRNRQV